MFSTTKLIAFRQKKDLVVRPTTFSPRCSLALPLLCASHQDEYSVVCVLSVNSISSVEFDKSGQFLATGDVSGRVCVYKAANADKNAGGRVSALLPYCFPSECTIPHPSISS